MEAIFILANPLPSTEYSHAIFAPWTISAFEGLLLGLILWRWTRAKPTIVLWGFLINGATLALFWTALSRIRDSWDYDYQIVTYGEMIVVAIETIAIVIVVLKVTIPPPRALWWKALGISLVLNILSYFVGALITQSPIQAEISKFAPTNKDTMTTNRASSVPGAMATHEIVFATTTPPRVKEGNETKDFSRRLHPRNSLHPRQRLATMARPGPQRPLLRKRYHQKLGKLAS